MHVSAQLKAKPQQPTGSIITDRTHHNEGEESYKATASQDICKIRQGDKGQNPYKGNGGTSDNANSTFKISHSLNSMALYSTTALSIQPKLTVNAPGDKYEQEAEEVADKIMRMPDIGTVETKPSSPNIIRRKCAACGKEEEIEEEPVQRMAIQRKCAKCEEEEKKGLQRKETGNANPAVSTAVERTLQSPGEPLNISTRSFMEQRFGFDFSKVQIHNDSLANQSARDINSLAYTHRHNIVFGAAQYQPQTNAGRKLLAHELTHVIQQSRNSLHSINLLQRYGDPIPIVKHPSVLTMQEYIALVRHIEAANAGLSALQIAQLIMRTKYNSQGFDYLLPTSSGGRQVTAKGNVTNADVTTLSGEFEVTLPQGGQSDPSHIVVAIVAGAETQTPGSDGAGGFSGNLIQELPRGLSQRDVATWVGDIASAAAEWETAHPHPHGGILKQDYMDEYAPESDLIADIDGIDMLSRSKSTGFVFDNAAPLSSNLEHFYFPTGTREGKNRRFHSFCYIEGLSLEADNVTLTSNAIAAINNRVHLNTDWFQRNDPNLITWLAMNGDGFFNPIRDAWMERANDWLWFAGKFRDFLQSNLRPEGP